MSRIGKIPIKIPDKVKVKIEQRKLTVEGPKGNLELTVHNKIQIELKDSLVMVKRLSDEKFDRSLHGLTRSLINNMIIGVTQGFSKQLEIEGVGFRAQLKGKSLNLTLGFTHPIDYPIPEGIKIETPKPTQIIVQGIDKRLVGQVAADIRRFFPPEPYKGKGIRYANEQVRRKQGKTVA